MIEKDRQTQSLFIVALWLAVITNYLDSLNTQSLQRKKYKKKIRFGLQR